MKTISKIYLCLLAMLAVSLTACDTDQECSEFLAAADNPSVTMCLPEVKMTLSNETPSTTVKVARGNNIDQPLDVTLEVKANKCKVESAVHFEAGERFSYFTIDKGNLQGGYTEIVEISVPEGKFTPGAISQMTIEVLADFEWNDIGEAAWCDLMSDDKTVKPMSVKAQKAIGWNRWRIVDPYASVKGKIEGGTALCAKEIQFYYDKDKRLCFDNFNIIGTYKGLLIEAQDKKGDSKNTWEGKIVKLSPNYFVPKLNGGFGVYTASVVIEMPTDAPVLE